MAAQDIGNWLNLIAFGGAELQSTFTSSGSLNASPLQQIVPFDTSGGGFSIAMATRAISGQKVTFIDIGLATSDDLTLTITDPNGYLFQDPDQPETLSATYVFEVPRNVTFVLMPTADGTSKYWATP